MEGNFGWIELVFSALVAVGFFAWQMLSLKRDRRLLAEQRARERARDVATAAESPSTAGESSRRGEGA